MLNLRYLIILLFALIISFQANTQIQLDLGVGNSFSNHEFEEISPELNPNAFKIGLSRVPNNFGFRLEFSSHKYETEAFPFLGRFIIQQS